MAHKLIVNEYGDLIELNYIDQCVVFRVQSDVESKKIYPLKFQFVWDKI